MFFCNLDLTIFRNPKQVGISSVPTRLDLDYWVHLRLFKQTETPLGATEMADKNTFPRGFIESVLAYQAIPSDRVKDTVDTNKIRWVLAIPIPGIPIKAEQTKDLLQKFGVQGVPYALYDTSATNKQNLEFWKASVWEPKPAPIRFVNNPPFKPATPSPKMNANGGNLSVPR